MADVTQPRRTCIFCGGTPLSRTHIWPNWLNKMVPVPAQRYQHIVRRDFSLPARQVSRTDRRYPNGSIFSQKPRLACVNCNTGWMKQFEDDVLLFGKPLITGVPTALSIRQIKTLAGWIALIAINAEFSDVTGRSVTVSERERVYLKRRKVPPENWAIFVAGVYGPSWTYRYTHHQFTVSSGHLVGAPPSASTHNSQVTSFGAGKLFVHVLSSPVWSLVDDFERAARASGLTQIWPIPWRIWPFPHRAAKFPPKLTLTDEEADVLEDAFHQKVVTLFGMKGSSGGYRL